MSCSIGKVILRWRIFAVHRRVFLYLVLALEARQRLSASSNIQSWSHWGHQDLKVFNTAVRLRCASLKVMALMDPGRFCS